MAVDLKKRFNRIVAILVHLQSKRIVKAHELAHRFDVSLRTIYRDIKSLEQAGVPIIGEAGSGYSLMEGYKLPPIIFSKEEALSFIGAEKLMEKYMDNHLIEDYKSAIYKIKAILQYADKDLIATLENKIHVSSPSYDFFNKQVPHALRIFFRSIASKQQVTIDYRGVNDALAQQRIVEPIGLYNQHGFWYIAAYCITRKDYRQFRADRISAITMREDNFEEERLSLDDFLQQQNKNNKKINIELLTSAKTAPYLHWERIHFGFKNEIRNGDDIKMHFEYGGSMDYFARWFLMFADDAEILEPLSLKNLVEELLHKSISRLKKTSCSL